MRLFDTHAHLTDERFDADRDELISSLPQKDVVKVVDICCEPEKLDETLALTRRYPFVYATAGIHPHDAGEATDQKLDIVLAAMKDEKVLALGEIGLDYHYDLAPREVQREWFARQLDAAIALDVPVSLHIREAFGDCMDILRPRKGRFRGIMHCYSGSVETARELVGDMGMLLAFGGSVTFKNANKLLTAAAELPLESILLETDAPYLAPEPFRGRRNDPSLVVYAARRIAEARGITTEQVAEATYTNAVRFFGLE